MQGGAELLQENLIAALRTAGHDAELVRLPMVWDRKRIFDAALAWRLAPIDADLVITTNFPSYFVRHPRKVLWLLHQHRAAYETLERSGSDFGADEDSMAARRLLTDWDTEVIGECHPRYALSAVVVDRLRANNGLDATPLYHPPPLFDQLRSGPYSGGLFSATRLEGNKRPDLLARAMKHTHKSVHLAVAGDGGMRAEVTSLARKLRLRDRFSLLGFVPDDELVERFASCRGVVYAPYDEDYGYVTLQAFRAGKAVITTSDAGGVLEWVEDGVTGLVADPDPASLADAMNRLSDDEELATRLGAAGKERVAGLDWTPVVRALTTR